MKRSRHDGSRDRDWKSGSNSRGRIVEKNKAVAHPEPKPSSAFLHALEAQRAAEAARARAAVPASAQSGDKSDDDDDDMLLHVTEPRSAQKHGGTATTSKPPPVVPRGMYFDPRANRLFKVTKGAPPEFLERIAQQTAQAAHRASQFTALAQQKAAHHTGGIVGRARLREIGAPTRDAGTAHRYSQAQWIETSLRAQVSVWRPHDLSLRAYPRNSNTFPLTPLRPLRMAAHASSGLLCFANASGSVLIESRTAADARISSATGVGNTTAFITLAGAAVPRDLPTLPGVVTSMERAPVSDRLLLAVTSLGSGAVPGYVRLVSASLRQPIADTAASDDGIGVSPAMLGPLAVSDHPLPPACHGSLWCGKWVGPDALALGLSSERPTILSRLLPDGRLATEATIVDDGQSDVFCFGTAHGMSAAPDPPSYAASSSTSSQAAGATCALYVGRRNGDVLLWDAREGFQRSVPSSGSSGGTASSSTKRCSSASKVMHVPSSVVAVEALCWPFVMVADADKTLQIRDCRKHSVPVADAVGYCNSVKRSEVAVSTDRRFIAAACSDRVVRCWSASSGALLFSHQLLPAKETCGHLLFLPPGVGMGDLSSSRVAVPPMPPLAERMVSGAAATSASTSGATSLSPWPSPPMSYTVDWHQWQQVPTPLNPQRHRQRPDEVESGVGDGNNFGLRGLQTEKEAEEEDACQGRLRGTMHFHRSRGVGRPAMLLSEPSGADVTLFC